jgi:hypothetical protein
MDKQKALELIKQVKQEIQNLQEQINILSK